MYPLITLIYKPIIHQKSHKVKNLILIYILYTNYTYSPFKFYFELNLLTLLN